MKLLHSILLTCALFCTTVFAMQQNTVNTTTAVVDCCICYAQPGTINTRTIFACANEHTELFCENCAHDFRVTRQNVGDYGFREWVCPLCRAPKIDTAQAPAPRPHAAQPAHQFHHNNNPGGGGGNKGGKAILLLMAAMGTIYFTAKYIYHRFKTQEKPANDTDNFSDFGFDDETCPAAISASDIDAFASSNSQSDVSIDEDWFN